MADALEQAEINGREIPRLAKKGVFQLLDDATIRCQCRTKGGKPSGPVLARFYVGPEGDTGRALGWVWVPSFRYREGKIPPTAAPIAMNAGDTAWTLHAQCGACRAWWLVFPGDVPEAKELAGKTAVMSHRPNVSAREPHKVGDPTVAGVVTSDWTRGPGPVVLVRVKTSEWGAVAP